MNLEKRLANPDWEAITFIADSSEGVNWKRIVKTDSEESGKLKAGSVTLHDPDYCAPPPWLSLKRAEEVYKLHFKNKKIPDFKNKKIASKIFWKTFKPKAQKPSDSDYSSFFSNGTKEPPKNMIKKVAKRKRVSLPSDTKIGLTGKKPKSKKNAARLKYYRKNKVSSILAKHPDITLADIKYDIKRGYAKIVS